MLRGPVALHPLGLARRAAAASVGLAVVGSALAGCKRAREQTYAQQVEVFERFHRVSWGEKLPDEGRKQHRRDFDCLWDALADAGRDPTVELGCWTRHMEATTACLETGKDMTACLARGAAACEPSPAYLAAAATCKSARPGD